MAVLAALRRFPKLARDHFAPPGKPRQRALDERSRELPPRRRFGGDERHMRAREATKQRFERFFTGVEECLRKPDRDGRAERLAIAAGVLGRDPSYFSGNANLCSPPPLLR